MGSVHILNQIGNVPNILLLLARTVGIKGGLVLDLNVLISALKLNARHTIYVILKMETVSPSKLHTDLLKLLICYFIL